MKTIRCGSTAFLFTLAMALMQCKSSQKIGRVEYNSLTRGFQKHIVITADSVITTISGREQRASRRLVTPEEWAAVQKSLRGVSLSEIPVLKSPSQAREYDGARHSTLTLFTGDGKTVAHTFDDEKANAKLMPLMSAVSAIEQTRAGQ
ncbi:hypothetical protein KK062_02715 [Fulvivirgaceae bacterium PWU5]|uniref:Uncharacterized protein n=1 Tax=Dawidia cretensis TaxID=2782350 RepID=A0AAP2GNF5_9BACT|nr:hypothetical protein [Dawidia cretensis]MBT1707114.1 hypothetical protein [Dawidia cretensis]